jgi:hypothetical protein
MAEEEESVGAMAGPASKMVWVVMGRGMPLVEAMVEVGGWVWSKKEGTVDVAGMLDPAIPPTPTTPS